MVSRGQERTTKTWQGKSVSPRNLQDTGLPKTAVVLIYQARLVFEVNTRCLVTCCSRGKVHRQLPLSRHFGKAVCTSYAPSPL